MSQEQSAPNELRSSMVIKFESDRRREEVAITYLINLGRHDLKRLRTTALSIAQSPVSLHYDKRTLTGNMISDFFFLF